MPKTLLNNVQKEISHDHYDDMMDAMPPIYIKNECINPMAKEAFALAEPHSHGASVICTVYWKQREGQQIKYYECLMEIYTPEGRQIIDTYAHQHGRNYRAKFFKA